MARVAIVDYGLCNLDSVARAVEECGGTAHVTANPGDLAEADHVILPGVGAFPKAIDNLTSRGLDTALKRVVLDGKVPFLGICLGMQLIVERSLEEGEAKGLGWISGIVRRLEPEGNARVPHMGWNEVEFQTDSPLFDEIETGKDFYFVHSYHVACDTDSEVLAHTSHGGEFASVIGRDNIFGVQFHPEKSQRVGFQLLRNFLAIKPGASC